MRALELFGGWLLILAALLVGLWPTYWPLGLSIVAIATATWVMSSSGDWEV